MKALSKSGLIILDYIKCAKNLRKDQAYEISTGSLSEHGDNIVSGVFGFSLKDPTNRHLSTRYRVTILSDVVEADDKLILTTALSSDQK